MQTTQANTTKLYITGTATSGTNTGTLSYDSNVYLNTTAGDLRATTFNGYTLAAASAKGVDTSLTSSSTSTNLPTSAAVVNLIKQYLPLTGGNVTGAVSFGSSVSADELTVGDLVVNGAASFTNNLQANTINGVEVGASPKFTDTVTTVTTSGNGNAVTAITASNGKLTVTKGTTFLTSYTETDPIFVASAAHGITSSDISNWNSKTSNTGTVTSVKVEGSNGLTGSGTVTTSGTITLSHADTSSQASSSNSGRTYIQSVTLDSYGHVTGLSTATETVTDTHYTANLITGASATAKANAAVTNGNVYLNLVENNTVRNAHKITGSGTTTVTSDADGNITISSADSKVGTVTSITLTQGTGITIGDSGTAITTSGSRTIGLADNYGDTKNPYASKTARYVLAAPANAAGAPSFRALTGADVGLGNVLNTAQVTGIGQGADGKIRVYKGDSNYEDVAVEIVATESSSVASAQKLTSYGGSTKQPVYFPNSGTNAGKPVAIGYTIETSVPSGAVFTDTTYTFANGTNGFTVTPLNGTAQTVTVTPSIANNITGSGTSGYLAKFNGANTITNGPALGTDTTKFLNNKGEWAIPTNTNTTYTLTNALSSHKFTWTFTAGGSGSGSTTTIAELAAGTGISLTDDANNKKITIGNSGVTGVKGNSESSYRTGQVNLTPANLGAVKGNSYLFYGTCDTEAATAEKEVTCADFTSNDLQPGAIINVYFTVTNSAAVANLQLNVNNTGAKPIRYIYNGSYSNIPGAGYIKLNQVYQFTYDGTYWVVQMIYNTDADWRVRADYGRFTAGVGGLLPYALVMKASDGRWESITTTSTTAKTKVKNTTGFLLDAIFFRNVNNTIAEGSVDSNWQMNSSNLCDARYHLNIENTEALKLNVGKSLYLVGTIGSDGLFYLDDTWWAQDLPTTANGKCYIYLGTIYDWYRYNLDVFHPIYKFINGKIRNISFDAVLVNGHTVEANVPSNAKFTDTWNALSTSQAGYVTKAPNDTGKFLRGDATWAAVTKANVGLGNVENTALSTWTGTNKITTVGTITTGTWNGSAIPITHGGTGQTTAEKAIDALLNGLPTWTANPTDSTYFIRQDTGGSATYGKAQFSTLWNYISGKISSSGKYVTVDTNQTLTAAGTKTYLGLQTYGTSGLALGVTSGTSVTQKAVMKYDANLDAIVFQF